MMAYHSVLTPKERTRLIVNSVLANSVDVLANARKSHSVSSTGAQRGTEEGLIVHDSTTSLTATAADDGSNTHWDNTMDSYVSLLNYSLGVGTIIGFPSKCYKHGGGIFVFPYLIMLFLEGIPLVCMEMVIGQHFQNKYIINTWGLVHASTVGIGMSAVFVSFVTLVYFNIIVSWCVRYFVYSFENPLAWGMCPEGLTKCSNGTRPSEFYWYDVTLAASHDISSVSSINWNLYLYVVIAWFLVFIYNIKGVKAAVKPGYALLVVGVILYVTLFMLVVHLDDWARGLAIFFNPNTDELRKLLTLEIWRDAAVQVFFSLGIGFGSLTVYASYNKTGFNTRSAALYYGLIDTTVGLCSCIIVFSFHGFQAHTDEKKCEAKLLQSNITLSDTNGTCQSYLTQQLPDAFSLAFITWSDSFTHIRYSNLWASLSYCLLLLSGLGSMSGMVLLVALSIREFVNIRQEFATGLVCLVSCIFGLFFVTDSGLYLVNFFNNYAAYPLPWVALLEVFSVFCIFGRKRFCLIIKDMNGEYPNMLWRFCWFIVSPAILVTLVAMYVYDLTKITAGLQYSTWEGLKGTQMVYYPSWCYIVIGVLGLVPLILIITMYIVHVIRSRRSLIQSCQNSWKQFWYACRKEEEVELQDFSEFQLRYGRNLQNSVDHIDANFPELLSFNNLVYTARDADRPRDDDNHHSNIRRHKSLT